MTWFEAQVFVDVGRGHLAGGNGPDGRGGAGDAVAAGEDALLAVQAAVGLGQEAAPANRYAALFKVVRLHALADGHQHQVGRDANLGHIGLVGPGPSIAAHGADDLRLYPEGHGVALFVGLDTHRGLEGEKLRALGQRALHLLGQGRHVLLAAAVDAADFLGAQADGAASDVHGHVAAADDDHLLAGEVGQDIVADAAQQLHR